MDNKYFIEEETFIMQNKIEKLEYYNSSPDGRTCVNHPNFDDIIDKLNEIIDFLNKEIIDNVE